MAQLSSSYPLIMEALDVSNVLSAKVKQKLICPGSYSLLSLKAYRLHILTGFFLFQISGRNHITCGENLTTGRLFTEIGNQTQLPNTMKL